MDLKDRIERNPKVMLGKPIIKDTRITVELIIRKLGEGASFEDLIDGYPNLTRDDIRAALLFAAASVALEDTVDLVPIAAKA